VKELQKQVCGVLAQPEIDIAGFGDAEQMLSFVCLLTTAETAYSSLHCHDWFAARPFEILVA
jgi:hypothetical protein